MKYQYNLNEMQIRNLIAWKEDHIKICKDSITGFTIKFKEYDDNCDDTSRCLPCIFCDGCGEESIFYLNSTKTHPEMLFESRLFYETINMAYGAIIACEKLHTRLSYVLTSLSYQQQNGMFDSKYDQKSADKHDRDAVDVIWDVITALGCAEYFKQVKEID